MHSDSFSLGTFINRKVKYYLIKTGYSLKSIMKGCLVQFWYLFIKGVWGFQYNIKYKHKVGKF